MAAFVFLLHREDANLGYPLQLRFESFQIGLLLDLPVVVGVEDGGVNCLDGFDGLIDGHRIGLIDRQEGDVDRFEGLHLGGEFRVAGDVDACAVDREDVAAILACLGVELRVPLRGVVGGNGLDVNPLARGGHASGSHRVAVHLEGFGRGAVADHLRLAGGQLINSRTVEVVRVVVRDQDDVGFGQAAVIGVLHHRINIYIGAVCFDGQRGVREEAKGELRSVLGLDGVGRVLRFLAATEKREK